MIAFGIARDIFGGKEQVMEVPEVCTVGALIRQIQVTYPAFEGLSSLRIAVNESYADNDQMIRPGDEVVVIPPVSGG